MDSNWQTTKYLPAGSAEMVEDRVHEKDFNLHTWYATIPMTDDTYLGLQAQNLARVEMNVVRRWESDVLDEQEVDRGNYQGPKCRELMALSQMWCSVFTNSCAPGGSARGC
jgi:hypothetical protein